MKLHHVSTPHKHEFHQHVVSSVFDKLCVLTNLDDLLTIMYEVSTLLSFPRSASHAETTTAKVEKVSSVEGVQLVIPVSDKNKDSLKKLTISIDSGYQQHAQHCHTV